MPLFILSTYFIKSFQVVLMRYDGRMPSCPASVVHRLTSALRRSAERVRSQLRSRSVLLATCALIVACSPKQIDMQKARRCMADPRMARIMELVEKHVAALALTMDPRRQTLESVDEEMRTLSQILLRGCGAIEALDAHLASYENGPKLPGHDLSAKALDISNQPDARQGNRNDSKKLEKERPLGGTQGNDTYLTAQEAEELLRLLDQRADAGFR